MILGETEVLLSEPAESGSMSHKTVRLRHEVPGQTLKELRNMDYRVAINPAHTEMGNLGKMFRR